ncbi:hypothetical protein J2T56_002190 [Natronobacillus azotifigens]|uniref:UPF0180 protein OWO01_12115 n=1 Tax=Natronobacillus azotifigens TaxID=472978 RepID=A0A9J6RES9_9BACI|nr:YkuS family protein [Natronobacillus azotifigens]MCZ0703957.1 YkuS family protein [Natronobacillus azotifigens]
MKKVGVESTLTDVTQALQQKGYETVELKEESDVHSCDCCVISGQDKNVMGMQDSSYQGSVINADGQSAEQVCKQVHNKID